MQGTDEDSAAFERELVAILPDLRAFARSLTGAREVADDLVQDTVIKALTAQRQFEPGTSMKAWTFTILRNENISRFRRTKRMVEDPDGEITASLTYRARQEHAIEIRDLEEALATLPRAQREALILVGAAGFLYEEAAAVCNCEVGTIKSRISRARAQLQKMLDPLPEKADRPRAPDGARADLHALAAP